MQGVYPMDMTMKKNLYSNTVDPKKEWCNSTLVIEV